MKIRDVIAYVLRHELPEADVFGSSKGWHTVRQSLLVEILTEDGLSGFGEAYGPPAVSRTLGLGLAAGVTGSVGETREATALPVRSAMRLTLRVGGPTSASG